MKTDLASVLKRVGRTSEVLLATIQGMQLTTLEQFNEAMDLAYAENKWGKGKGRPKAGSKLKPAPDAVQRYVSYLRSAYKAGLDVMSLKSMREMVDAVKAAKGHAEHPEPRPELKGLVISAAKKMTGSFWHDRLVMWEMFPPDRQEEVMRRLDAIMMEIADQIQLPIPKE